MYGTVSSFVYSLSDTFLLNNRATLLLLDALDDRQLAHVPTPRARSIADQLAHMHKVRVTWLEVASPGAAKSMSKIEKGAADKRGLRAALQASAAAIAALLTEAEATGKLRGYKRGPAAFCGYLLAHEGHHRGQILVHLKNAGMAVDKSVAFGIWEWEKI
jgi:uncharacterized damage-inducible protein DinB